MDGFAQTRQPDDLFDDDFTPYIEPAAEPIVEGPPPAQQNAKIAQQKMAISPAAPATPPKAEPPETISTADASSRPVTKSELKPPLSLSVRGDRSATGGILKPKLTEDELSARLTAARLNNAKREEAHRLAEADEAEFQQREAQEIQKRRQEGIARREMDREREKNRQRKLAVKSGREWDESKEEVKPTTMSGGTFRGANGGYRGSGRRGSRDVRDLTSRDGEYGARGRGRGRGLRGDYRGDRGRGGRSGQTAADRTNTKVPTASDFPELPKAGAGAGAGTGPDKPKFTAAEVDRMMKSPPGPQQSWADQVEASK